MTMTNKVLTLLTKILTFPVLNPKKVRGEETLQCITLANELKILSLKNKLNCVWFHVSNENPVAKKFVHWSKIQKAMGKTSGAPDYVFLWKGGCACVEMKSSKGRLSENQIIFKEWCDFLGIDYIVCYTAQHVLSLLKNRYELIK